VCGSERWIEGDFERGNIAFEKEKKRENHIFLLFHALEIFLPS